MKKITGITLAAAAFGTIAQASAAETVSELVSAGQRVVHVEVSIDGRWAWMYLGEADNAPLYVCQIETPSHPDPSDRCRKLK